MVVDARTRLLSEDAALARRLYNSESERAIVTTGDPGPEAGEMAIAALCREAERRTDARWAEERAALCEVAEAARPFARMLDRWPYVAGERDLGRLNYDSGLTADDVEKMRAALARLDAVRAAGEEPTT